MSGANGSGPYRGPKLGTILRDDHGDSSALVVAAASTDVLDALRELVSEGYGGDWSRENPVLAEVASGLRIECWRSCTKAWREGENIDDDWATDWWAPSGDGARYCFVLRYEGNLYALGERALVVEPLATASARSGEAPR